MQNLQSYKWILVQILGTNLGYESLFTAANSALFLPCFPAFSSLSLVILNALVFSLKPQLLAESPLCFA